MNRRTITFSVLILALAIATSAMAADVYATKNGKKYHKEDCRLIKTKSPEKISQKEAMERGLLPCGKCFKDEVSSVTEKGKENRLEAKAKKL